MHRLTLAVLVSAVLASGMLATILVGVSADEPGPRLALFAPGTGEGLVLAAVAASDGTVMRGSRLPGVWHVAGSDAGFAARLRSHGAWLVLPPIPLDWAALGGCSYLVPGTYAELTAAERKLRAGPM